MAYAILLLSSEVIYFSFDALLTTCVLSVSVPVPLPPCEVTPGDQGMMGLLTITLLVTLTWALSTGDTCAPCDKVTCPEVFTGQCVAGVTPDRWSQG